MFCICYKNIIEKRFEAFVEFKNKNKRKIYFFVVECKITTVELIV